MTKVWVFREAKNIAMSITKINQTYRLPIKRHWTYSLLQHIQHTLLPSFTFGLLSKRVLVNRILTKPKSSRS